MVTALLVEHADDQPTTVGNHVAEQALDQIAPPERRDILEAGPHDVKAVRWLPVDRVPGEDPIAPVRQPPARQVGELGREIEAVRLARDAGRAAPANHALHQVAARTGDV
ncbi:MAG TPA: hypothetical protein VF469_21510 [Kofleriaceae bacterium]